jgi:hypothetical protein
MNLRNVVHLSLRCRALAACLIAACQSTPIAGVERLQTFTSQRLGYSVSYPVDWRAEVVSDVFYIENFPQSKAVRAVRLPAGGAGIKILLSDQTVHNTAKLPKTLEEFVKLDTSHERIEENRHLEVADRAHRIPVLEVITECCAVAPYQESVAWYFELSGRMFVASLTYWQGEPRADTFRQTLKEIVLSLRVTETAPK